ncbi:hypothetical protein JMJ35_006562 [Cladonia borealis]|uniref:Uncharacterized protein n=1 Tax=Cladonia borealis TaxID=184061 RepID=A0AA39QZK8_9LECA|nr:hypothetical protein JMJ35_006562 [Cladonia borealis]
MDPKLKDKTEDRAQDQAANPNMEGSASLSTRIGNSASGILQNVFARPSASALAETLGSLNADTSKSAASSSASTGDASSSSQAVLTQETSPARGQSMVGESFRSEQARGGIHADRGQLEFDEFAQTSRLQGCDNSITQSLDLGNFERPAMVGDHCPCVFCRVGKLHQNRETYGPEVEPATSSSDGAAVVALLSDPTFDVDEEPMDTWAVLTTEKGKSKLESQPVERHLYDLADILASVNPLDLLPNFKNSWSPPTRSSSCFGEDTSLGPAFGDLQPWTDILNRYHDEVWGDMLPLVKEAREELKSANSSPGGTPHDRPALRRLGMLLNHLHQPIL